MYATLKKTLRDRATECYRKTGYFNFQWARGKLGNDPVFPALIDMALLPDGARIIDVGCGRGLLAAWLLAAEDMANHGEWSGAPMPPRNLSFYGIELMEREVVCGNNALRPRYGNRVLLAAGDMRSADLDKADAFIILDVLHYVPIADQEAMLDRIREALPVGGLLITRVGNAKGGTRFKISQAVDYCMSWAQGHRLDRMWCRSVDQWILTLNHRGFTVEARPMSAGTPFANMMLVARLTGSPRNALSTNAETLSD